MRLGSPLDVNLAKNTLWVASGQVLRVVIQAVYFVVIARALGSRDYGAYVAVLAMVAIAAPFASLGSGNLLIKHIARVPETFRRHWGKALATTVLSGTILLGLVTIIARLWLPPSIPLQLVLILGAADLVFVRLVDVSAQAYQGHQRLSRTALLQLLLSPLRLIAAIVLVAVVPAPSAMVWGALYLLSAILSAILAVALVNRELGGPTLNLRHLASELAEGASFSVSLSAQSCTNDIDKAMLARLGTLEATGVYAAAYRIVDVAFVPVGSLLVATYARFFQQGAQGLEATARFARRFLTLGLCYGVMAAAGLYLCAPLLPAVLGQEYRQAGTAVRWLALLPLLKTVHYLGSDTLTGAGYQGVRTLLQVSVAGVNVLLNIWLIPILSWRGAAISTLVSDALQGVVIWTAVWYLSRYGDHEVGASKEAKPVVQVG